MSYNIITISREFGSAGHIIGQKLSEKLSYNYYNQNLISLAAEKSGYSENILGEADEKAANPWLYAAMSQTNQTSFGKIVCTNDALFSAQSEIIKGIASKENAVIVGRCADYILKTEDVNLTNVFIYAPMKDRIKRTMERENIDENKAVSLIKKSDKQRKMFHDFYTDEKWGERGSYDIMINSGKFSIDEIVEMIIKLI